MIDLRMVEQPLLFQAIEQREQCGRRGEWCETAGQSFAPALGEAVCHLLPDLLVVVPEVGMGGMVRRDALREEYGVCLSEGRMFAIAGHDGGESVWEVFSDLFHRDIAPAQFDGPLQHRVEQMLLAGIVVQHALPTQADAVGNRIQ